MHPDLVQLSAAEIRLMHRPRTPPVSDGSALQSLAAGPEICAGFVAVITPGRAVRPPPPVSARVNFLKGEISVYSVIGTGTTTTITIPFTREMEENETFSNIDPEMF